jgi:potassium efflux system protein
MAAFLRRFACNLAVAAAIFGLVLAGNACAFAQAPDAAKPAANTAPAASDEKSAAQPAGPQINAKAIVARLNQELGLDLQATTTGWQHELDRIEGELGHERLRYSDLNLSRDALLRVRAQAEDVAGRLQPRLDADKAQLNLLGPAPAAGQPPEPDQAAVSRAELNYHIGLLSAGQAAVNSANLRIDALLNTIQDIRRKNFASILFQPIPGLYAYQTWAKLPQDVPAAASKLHDLVADWWDGLSDPETVEHIAIGALLAALVWAS